MYLRFVTTQIDEVSHKPQGIFQAGYELLEAGELNADEWKQLRSVLDWFVVNLPTPPEQFRASRATFWFRSSAHESVNRIWELVEFLRQHGRYVEVYKCRHLRNIHWYDHFQVAAYPSHEDGKVTVQ